jgi:hypothetical protein
MERLNRALQFSRQNRRAGRVIAFVDWHSYTNCKQVNDRHDE